MDPVLQSWDLDAVHQHRNFGDQHSGPPAHQHRDVWDHHSGPPVHQHRNFWDCHLGSTVHQHLNKASDVGLSVDLDLESALDLDLGRWL